MANPNHVEILHKGVAAWNAWRQENPDIIPDLNHVDFHRELIDNPMFTVPQNEIDLRNRRFNLPEWTTMDVMLTGIDFSRTNLWGARLHHCRFARANLFEADLWGADLTGADLWGTDLTGAVMRQTNISGVRLAEATYDRRRMLGQFFGIQGAETCYGHPILRRDILDQEYIDAFFRETRIIVRPTWQHIDKLDRAFEDWSRFGRPRGVRWRALHRIMLRKLLFEFWRLTDFGRSMGRVVIFAAVMIAAFGFAFDLAEQGGALSFLPTSGTDNAFRPYFAAAIGFSTLGLTDILVANTLAGQLLLLGNVLSGFTSLGLLLAVFGNKFARRA
ncbi:MAG: pentapeptide repeat-containing protein [Alphaproteobacteria bacterium]